MSLKSPMCDSFCNKIISRNRPIQFNVDQSGYYKICMCKMSSNAPFCNGTHIKVQKFLLSTIRGKLEYGGIAMYFATFGFMFWNFFT
jgi:hypothetical protein